MSSLLQEWIALGVVFAILIIALTRYINKRRTSRPHAATCSGCDKQANCNTTNTMATKPVEFLARQ